MHLVLEPMLKLQAVKRDSVNKRFDICFRKGAVRITRRLDQLRVELDDLALRVLAGPRGADDGGGGRVHRVVFLQGKPLLRTLYHDARTVVRPCPCNHRRRVVNEQPRRGGDNGLAPNGVRRAHVDEVFDPVLHAQLRNLHLDGEEVRVEIGGYLGPHRRILVAVLREADSGLHHSNIDILLVARFFHSQQQQHLQRVGMLDQRFIYKAPVVHAHNLECRDNGGAVIQGQAVCQDGL